MKKVIILSPAHPLRGGIASSSERLGQEFLKEGVELTIYSFHLQYPAFLFPGKSQYTDDPPPQGLTIKSLVNSVNPLNWIKVGRLIRKEKPDVLVVRYWLPFMAPCLGTIIRIAKSNRHTKVIALADNIIPHEKRPGDRLFTAWFVASVDGFVVMSRSVKNDIRQFSPDKQVTYIPHPLYDNYGKAIPRREALKFLRLPEGVRYLLFFGFIRDYKGLDLLIRAMADERIKRLNLKLIVAGEFYSERELYEQLIHDEGVEDQLILKTVFIPHDEVKYYFGAANLVVQPYKSATQSGISQLAYHFEKPMVVTKVGGLPEIVEHGKGGYVVEVDVEAIAGAIADFFENDREMEMTRGLIENKRRFSWANMVKGFRSMYENLLI